jgi:hypothetical protein
MQSADPFTRFYFDNDELLFRVYGWLCVPCFHDEYDISQIATLLQSGRPLSGSITTRRYSVSGIPQKIICTHIMNSSSPEARTPK